MIKLFEEYINSIEYNSIVYESKTNSLSKKANPNIVFITKNPKGENSTGEFNRFKSSADKYGVNIYAFDIDKVSYKLTNDNNILSVDGVGDFSKDNSIFFFRHSIRIKDDDKTKKITQDNVKKIKELLKSNNFIFSNQSSVSSICKNKFKTFDLLNKKGVDTIKTIKIEREEFISNNLENVNNMLNHIKSQGIELPVVVKVVDGTQGNGVFLCKDEQILSSIVQYLVKSSKSAGECIIQPYCDIDNDVRVHVFCKSLHPENANVDDFVVIGSMKRDKAENDFRTNFSLGGHISKYSLNKEEEDLAKQAALAIGAIWCGVDICYDKITKKYYVIEINSSPALKGISQISDKLPTDIIVKHIKKTLSGKVTEDDLEDRELVSYYETVELDGIPIMGMFDTGNSCMCAIKSDHFKIDGDKLEFKLGDEIVTKDIIRKKSILHGGIKSDKRPVVKFDITFNGKTIEDVEVCVRNLTDVEKKRKKEKNEKFGNKILLTTDVINKLKLIVHPDRDNKFLKTKKIK